MGIIRFSGFAGENRAVEPKLLADTVGVKSINQKPGRGDLRPWGGPAEVATVEMLRKSIYRMGGLNGADGDNWLSWPEDVNTVRGPHVGVDPERIYYSGDGAPKWTNISLAIHGELLAAISRFVSEDSLVLSTGAPFLRTSSKDYPVAHRPLGIKSPPTPCILTASGGVSPLSETRFYTYTYVSDRGEEGPPAQPSLELTCRLDDTVSISGLDSPSELYGDVGLTAMRIYRTQSGSGTTDNFFKLERLETADGQVYSELPFYLTAALDKNSPLAEVLPTTTWLPPPDDLIFLTAMWNGMVAGISNGSVRFSDSYAPYSWPIEYDIVPTNARPVALSTFGQTLVVLTDGNPSTVTGGSPESMDESPAEFSQACVAPKSAVGMGHGVAWASPDGLAYIGNGGPRLLTAGIMTRKDWQALNPSTIHGCMYEGQYFGFYGDNQCFILDPANPTGMYFLDFGCTALHLDYLRDGLYILNGASVQKFDAGAARTTTFRSKVFRQTKPVSAFACAEVVGGQTIANPASFALYVDGSLKHTQAVTSDSPFRLPGGYYGQDFQIEVSTSSNIQGVAMAHSMKELAST